MRVTLRFRLLPAAVGVLVIAGTLGGCAPPAAGGAANKVVLNTDGSAAVVNGSVTVNASTGQVGVDAGNGVTLNTNGTVSFHM